MGVFFYSELKMIFKAVNKMISLVEKIMKSKKFKKKKAPSDGIERQIQERPSHF